jgi:hypothetical protein
VLCCCCCCCCCCLARDTDVLLLHVVFYFDAASRITACWQSRRTTMSSGSRRPWSSTKGRWTRPSASSRRSSTRLTSLSPSQALPAIFHPNQRRTIQWHQLHQQTGQVGVGEHVHVVAKPALFRQTHRPWRQNAENLSTHLLVLYRCLAKSGHGRLEGRHTRSRPKPRAERSRYYRPEVSQRKAG